jgi:hypothetical protein
MNYSLSFVLHSSSCRFSRIRRFSLSKLLVGLFQNPENPWGAGPKRIEWNRIEMPPGHRRLLFDH